MKSREHRAALTRAYRARHKKRLREARASNLDARYNDLRGRALRNGRKFRISRDTYKNMIKGGCYYCGADLMKELGGSLDRANNSNRNYTTRNVVPCCTKCNNIKSKFLTKDEMSAMMLFLKKMKEGDKYAVEISRTAKRDSEAKRAGQIKSRAKARRSNNRGGAK